MSEGIVKKGNRYFVVIEGDPDPVTGKRSRKWHSGYDDEESAKKARRRLLVDRDEGAYVDPDRQTVTGYFAEWLKAIRPTVRDSTWHSYERNLRLHVSAYVGRVQLRRLDATGLNALYAHLLAEGHKGHHGDQPAGLSPRTVRYIHTIIHRALKDAVRWGRLVRNVADAADPPRASTGSAPEVQAWSRETLIDFLDRSKSSEDRYYPLWVLLATTGCRRGEALGLRWSDVDLKAGRAAIVQTVITVKHEVRIGTPKTAKGKRSVSLDPATVSVLKDWRGHQLEEKVLLGPGYRDHDLIFAKATGEPLHPERVSREFDRRVERWDLPKLTVHGLRHTWATLALAAGVHPKVVQERLGHTTIGITLDLYSHTTPTLHDEAAHLVAGQILG
jgi:integrase